MEQGASPQATGAPRRPAPSLTSPCTFSYKQVLDPDSDPQVLNGVLEASRKQCHKEATRTNNTQRTDKKLQKLHAEVAHLKIAHMKKDEIIASLHSQLDNLLFMLHRDQESRDM